MCGGAKHNVGVLHIQKLRAMFWFRQHAGFVFAEDAIAIARHHLVNQIAKHFRQDTPDCGQLPYAAQLLKHVENGIGTCQQSFVRLAVVPDDVDRVEVVGVHAVIRHQRLRKVALQRRKSKTIVCVALEKKLHQVIAESANTVVQNDWIGFDSRQVLELPLIVSLTELTVCELGAVAPARLNLL